MNSSATDMAKVRLLILICSSVCLKAAITWGKGEREGGRKGKGKGEEYKV